jgi:hypothetical protein
MHDKEGGIWVIRTSLPIRHCIALHPELLHWCQWWDAEVSISRRLHFPVITAPGEAKLTEGNRTTQVVREPSLVTRLRPGTLPLWGSSRGNLLGTRGDRVCQRWISSREGRGSHHGMEPITVTCSLCTVKTHCFCTQPLLWSLTIYCLSFLPVFSSESASTYLFLIHSSVEFGRDWFHHACSPQRSSFLWSLGI